MHRTAVGAVIAAMVLIAPGLAVALDTSHSPRPANQLVVQGRVTGTGGKPVSGIKVWLIEFDITQGQKGPQAENVKVIG